MAKKSGSRVNPGAKAAILLLVLGVVIFFVLVTKGTWGLVDTSPYLVLGICAILLGMYSGYTSNLLYQYYNVRKPWYGFIPCYGELTLMDNKFLRMGSIAYVVACIFLILSRLPYSVFKILGSNLAIQMPFYFTIVAIIAFLAVQVIKGIGLVDCMHTVSEEWNEAIHGELGLIKSFCWFGFVPFVRIIAIYALNKPLSTLVSFNHLTINDDISLELAEDTDE